MTKVINIRNAPRGWKSDPSFAYIGRAGKGLDGCFGNPFPLPPGESRGATLDKFRKYFHERLAADAEFKSKVDGLAGKTLVCFCAPAPCHGDVIVEYLEAPHEHNPHHIG